MANVNLTTGRAKVEYDPAAVRPKGLIWTIESAGYGVEKRETGFGVTGMTYASCVGRR